MNEFRPISLCNVLYKIFSKVLANRLKKILPSIITEHQLAFTKDRLISDNILMAFETLHCMKRHNSGTDGYMALKLDISKAYDRVEYVFFEDLTRKMGFKDKWIGFMMVCVKTVTYSILVNGEPQGMIQPTRGIRQGDPLSPFLFLLRTKGQHGIINKAASMREIIGFSLCKRGPKLTHLLFADDSLLFCKATDVECGKVMQILSTYEEASGQKINKNKTAVCFSKPTKEDTRESIKGILGVQETNHYDKYLGLPSLLGRGKMRALTILKKGYDGNYKVGKASSCHMPVEKFCSNQSSKQSQHMQ